MSGVKRYIRRSPDTGVLGSGFGLSDYVLASDYDACASRLHEVAEVCAIAEQERDALRAQVEAMRELLRKVAPHFAAPPGLGYLYQEIDAALQEPGEEK